MHQIQIKLTNDYKSQQSWQLPCVVNSLPVRVILSMRLLQLQVVLAAAGGLPPAAAQPVYPPGGYQPPPMGFVPNNPGNVGDTASAAWQAQNNQNRNDVLELSRNRWRAKYVPSLTLHRVNGVLHPQMINTSPVYVRYFLKLPARAIRNRLPSSLPNDYVTGGERTNQNWFHNQGFSKPNLACVVTRLMKYQVAYRWSTNDIMQHQPVLYSRLNYRTRNYLAILAYIYVAGTMKFKPTKGTCNISRLLQSCSPCDDTWRRWNQIKWWMETYLGELNRYDRAYFWKVDVDSDECFSTRNINVYDFIYKVKKTIKDDGIWSTEWVTANNTLATQQTMPNDCVQHWCKGEFYPNARLFFAVCSSFNPENLLSTDMDQTKFHLFPQEKEDMKLIIPLPRMPLRA